MANVFYLDVDDEITSAAARIRTSQDPRVGLVIPPGSRIATSRINFRLLAREALERNRALSIVSTDAAARALAASAGLPAFATVAEFEAYQGPARGGAATAAGGVVAGGASSIAGGGLAADRIPGATGAGNEPGSFVRGPLGGPPGASDGRVGARSSGASAPAVRAASRTAHASARVAATVFALVVMVLVVGLIAVFLLPSATITVTPRLEAVSPLELSVRADPNATASDPVAGVVPAVVLTKDFTSFGTFNATGQKVESTAATGVVKFTNYDTSSPVTITAGSKVSTVDGITFATTQDLTVPSAHPHPFKQTTGSVNITAAGGGPAGNVAAGTIVNVPNGYRPDLLNVTNPTATTGGTKTTTIQIQKKDTDAAVANLTKGLKQQFTTWLAAPDALAPGSTAFPKTGVLGTAAADTDPATLIGITQPTFQLTMTATGTETAVDEQLITSLALGRLSTSVPSQYSLVNGSEKVTLGTPRTDGTAVVFPVTATASQVRHLDPDTLRQQVKGKSVDEARSILSQDGIVDIQTWPGFVGTIPSLEWRLTLTIDTSVATGSPGPSSSIAPTLQPAASPPGSAAPSSPPSSGPPASGNG